MAKRKSNLQKIPGIGGALNWAARPTIESLKRIPGQLSNIPGQSTVARGTSGALFGGGGGGNPAAGSFPMSGQGTNPYLYSSGSLNDPNRTMFDPAEAAPAAPTGQPDFMAMLRQLMAGASGGGGGGSYGPPPPAFDASPFQQLIAQAQQQAQLGQGTIDKSTQGLMSQLGGLRSQFETRNAEDQAAIQGTQAKALQGAQGSLSPVLADLAAQGVDTRGIEQMAGQRIGTLSDQAALQNTLGQRMAQNTGNTLSATERSGALSGAGATNQLAANLSGVTAGIQGQQAGAQAQYMQDLARYNAAQQKAASGGRGGGLGGIKDAVGIMKTLGLVGGKSDPDVRSEWSTREGSTADAVNELFGQLDVGEFGSADDLIGNLDTKRPDPKDSTKQITGWDEFRASHPNVNINTVKAALKQAAKPTAKNNTTPDLAALMAMLG